MQNGVFMRVGECDDCGPLYIGPYALFLSPYASSHPFILVTWITSKNNEIEASRKRINNPKKLDMFAFTTWI